MIVPTEERLKWWREARFGMFIHWGLYSSLAGEWKGKRTKGIGEWIMHELQIPISEYETIADRFNPMQFDAGEWAELAKRAGMKYLVVTAKHHDGFCMFDSPSNPYNIVTRTPFKRDPMKELADACNERGIRMCFYYSQALDWHAPGGAGHWETASDGERGQECPQPPLNFQKYLDEVVKPNVRELLTNYGPIGLIWFDVPLGMSKAQSEDLRDFVHDLQPECLASGRVGNGVGDYGSLGDNEHPCGKIDGAWESPATLNDTWGFKSDDHNWKSTDHLLELLINCASKDVNYLLNVGPTAEGIIPEPSVERLNQIGEWLSRYGEAIYGASASPFPVDPAWGRMTCKGNVVYLLIREWPTDGKLRLVGLRNAVRSAHIPGDEGARLEVNQDGDTVTVSLPITAPDERVSVVAVELDGEPEVEETVIQESEGEITLPAHVAQVQGGIVIARGGHTAGWMETASSASWCFRLYRPGRYEIAVITFGRKRVPQRNGNHGLKIAVAAQTITGTAGTKDLDMSENAPGPQKPRSVLGSATLEHTGEYRLELNAETLDPDAPAGLELFAIHLTPIHDV